MAFLFPGSYLVPWLCACFTLLIFAGDIHISERSMVSIVGLWDQSWKKTKGDIFSLCPFYLDFEIFLSSEATGLQSTNPQAISSHTHRHSLPILP